MEMTRLLKINIAWKSLITDIKSILFCEKKRISWPAKFEFSSYKIIKFKSTELGNMISFASSHEPINLNANYALMAMYKQLSLDLQSLPEEILKLS